MLLEHFKNRVMFNYDMIFIFEFLLFPMLVTPVCYLRGGKSFDVALAVVHARVDSRGGHLTTTVTLCLLTSTNMVPTCLLFIMHYNCH